MATNANKLPFNFKGRMNLNLNRNEIKTDIEFNEKNSPVFGGALSPIWKKNVSLNSIQQKVIFDTEGNQWSINNNNKLAKNGVELANSPDLSYSWREDSLGDSLMANEEVLAYSAVDNIPDMDTLYGDTDYKGGFVKVYKKLSNGKVYIRFKSANEDNIVETNINFDTWDYKFKIIWNTRKITYDGTTYDTIRPVIFQYYMFDNNQQMFYNIWFPSIENELGLPCCLFGETTFAGNGQTTAYSGIGNGSWFVEVGELVNSWSDNGTTKNRGLLGGSIYGNAGHYKKDDDILSTNFVFDIDVPTSGTITLKTWQSFTDDITGGFKHRIYGVYGKRFAGSNPTQAVIVNLGVDEHQDAGIFVASASNSSSNVLTLTTLQNYYGYQTSAPTTVAYSFDIYPGNFKCLCAKKVGTQFTISYSTTVTSGMYKPLTLSNLDITSDTDVSDGFGAIRHKDEYTYNYYSEVLLNNGFMTGFHSPYGNLITEWNTIDTETEPVFIQQLFNTEGNYLFTNDEDSYMRIYYTNTQKEKKVLTRTRQQTKILEIYANRYILTDADAEFNAYDIYTGSWFKWTSDWNNRLQFTQNRRTSFPTTGTKTYYTLTPTPELSGIIFASAMNANYEITAKPFISAQFPAVIGYVQNSPNASIYYVNIGGGFQTIDIYFSEIKNNAYAVYNKSIFNSQGNTTKTYLDSEFADTTYPTGDIVYNLCLLTEFIKSYNNLDYVVFGGDFLGYEQSKNAYSLLYFNNSVIFGYMISSFIENIKAIFVIQTSTYFVIGDKIAYVSFNGQSVSGMTFLTAIKGLQYIGALPDMALFYSPINKILFSFTGDSILRPFLEASNIANIISTFYLPEIQAIIISFTSHYGENKSLIFTQDNIFELDYGDIRRVQYDSTTQSIILTRSSNAVKISFSYPLFSDFTSDKVKFQTEFIGIGNEQVGIMSSWLIRLYQANIICPTDGEIIIRQNTITDKGTMTEEKKLTITKSDWDKVTNGYYFRYQPQYQRGVGFQLEIISDFAIQSIVGEIAQDTTQISKFNI